MLYYLLLSYLPAFVLAIRNPIDSNKRDILSVFTFDKIFWVNDGPYRCTSKQKGAILAAIDDAHILTHKVIEALSVRHAEQSTAFLTWFGQEHSFKSLITNLKHPQLPIKIDGLNNRAPSPATANSLVYACNPETPKDTALAITHSPSPGDPYDGPTYLAFHHLFFEENLSLQQMVNEWKRIPYRKKFIPSRALTLIHEFQHMYLATGLDHWCDDVPDPAVKSRHAKCYDFDCSCKSIPDNQKIINAQNFAIFAEYIYTWPETAKVPLKYRLRPW
ncbi:hypothetical protein LX36DRAFT_647296 [Colletotrichum falcatum]|nr:hypothetical protein LX36DRAFT_647296 [Colletotrichum falcatum]